jgi:hypothetical protein
LEEKLLNAMSHNQKTNERVTAIDGKMDKMATMLEQIVIRMDQIQQLPMEVPNQSPVAALPSESGGRRREEGNNNEVEDGDSMDEEDDDDNAWVSSPVKKKKKTIKQNTPPSGEQYKEKEPEAGRDKC